jgi:hypothetical protein
MYAAQKFDNVNIYSINSHLNQAQPIRSDEIWKKSLIEFLQIHVEIPELKELAANKINILLITLTNMNGNNIQEQAQKIDQIQILRKLILQNREAAEQNDQILKELKSNAQELRRLQNSPLELQRYSQNEMENINKEAVSITHKLTLEQEAQKVFFQLTISQAEQLQNEQLLQLTQINTLLALNSEYADTQDYQVLKGLSENLIQKHDNEKKFLEQVKIEVYLQMQKNQNQQFEHLKEKLGVLDEKLKFFAGLKENPKTLCEKLLPTIEKFRDQQLLQSAQLFDDHQMLLSYLQDYLI